MKKQLVNLYVLILFGIITCILTFNCYGPKAPRVLSPLLLAMNDTSVAINDSVFLHVKSAHSDKQQLIFLWSFDSGLTFSDTTYEPNITVIWRKQDVGKKLVIVKAQDLSGIQSDAESIWVTILLNAPFINEIKDTSVFINDTLTLEVLAYDSNGRIIAYFWQVDSANFIDTTEKGFYTVSWNRLQAGRRTIRVTAMDDDSLLSNTITFNVDVMLGAPIIESNIEDLQVQLNDTLALKVKANDANGNIIYYKWSFDGNEFVSFTSAEAPDFLFCQNKAGKYIVTVKAVDDDTVESEPVSFTVTVILNPPYLKLTQDTTVYRRDTVHVNIEAFDSNGVITAYFWDNGNGKWDTSATKPKLNIFWSEKDTSRWVIGIKDDDNNIVTDTIVVIFRPLPFVPIIKYPADKAVVIFKTLDSSFQRGDLSLQFGIRDMDSIEDKSIEYKVSLRAKDSDKEIIYKGKDSIFHLTSLDTVEYVWTVEAINDDGYKSTATATFRCLLQRQLCFLGHSIIVGTGSKLDKGGFRADVLEGLRRAYKHPLAVKPIGPLVTGCFTLNPEDDSCMAVIGSQAYQMYDSIVKYPSLNVNIWIIMLGVNGGYLFLERFYLERIFTELYKRNPSAEVYVLNGLPISNQTDTTFSDSTIAVFNKNREEFNQYLKDSLKNWQQKRRWKIYLVDAFSAIAKNNLWSPDHFADALHPNDKGYELLAKEILKQILEKPIE